MVKALGLSSRAVGILLVLFAAVTWSLAGLGIKVLWDNPFAVAGFRSLFALPVVLSFLRARSPVAAALPGLKKPLLWAAAIDFGDTGMIRLLLDAGARRDATNKDGLTPVQLARAHHNPELAAALNGFNGQIPSSKSQAPPPKRGLQSKLGR